MCPDRSGNQMPGEGVPDVRGGEGFSSGRLLRLISDNSPDLLWAKDLEGRYLFANRAISEKLLIAENTEEPLGKTDLYFAERQRKLHPDNPHWHTFGELCVDSDQIVIKEQQPMCFDEFGNYWGSACVCSSTGVSSMLKCCILHRNFLCLPWYGKGQAGCDTSALTRH